MSVTKDSKNKKKKVPSSGYIAKAIPHGMIQVGTADDGTKIYSASAQIMKIYYPDLYKMRPNRTDYIFIGNNGIYTPITSSNDEYDKFIDRNLLRYNTQKSTQNSRNINDKSTKNNQNVSTLNTVPASAYDEKSPIVAPNIERYTYWDPVNVRARDIALSKDIQNRMFQNNLLEGTLLFGGPPLLALGLSNPTTALPTIGAIGSYMAGSKALNDAWAKYVSPDHNSFDYDFGNAVLDPLRLAFGDKNKASFTDKNATIVGSLLNPVGLLTAKVGAYSGKQLNQPVYNAYNSVKSGVNKLGNNIQGAVVTYKQAFPYMKQLIADNNTYAGLGNTVNRTIKSIPKFASPKFMRQMMESPDMVKNSDLWWWSNFSKNQWRNLQSNWAKEAAKGKYYFSNSPNPGNSAQQISSAFETGRQTASGMDKSKNLAQSVVDSYNQKMEAITDPVLKHIVETSPQYLDEVYEQQLRGGATPDFVRDLIKKANSYRRAMRGNNLTSEDFLTYKGRGSNNNISTIDVEGENMSGNYGSVQAYFEGQPKLEGDMSTWWDQRIPEGVNSSEVVTLPDGKTITLESVVKPGIHSVEPYAEQITNLEPQGEQLPIIQTFYDTYRQSGLPFKHVIYPVHQVFYGKTNTMLPNFKVTVGRKPFNFNYGKGYKHGGKINKYF